MNKFFFITFLCLTSFTFSQEGVSCKLDNNFTDKFYYYDYDKNIKASESESKKKLVASIFSLIENKTRLELTNKDGKSYSSFSQTSIIKSKAAIINPSKCVNDKKIVVYINKREFNNQFLKIYRTDINLIINRLNSILNESINRGSQFLEDEVQKNKIEFNEANQD